MERDPEQIADEWLVLSAQAGSRAALDALVRRWQPKLLAHARQVTGRRDAAGDVVQEAWLSILRSLDGLRDPAAFRGWAYRIVHFRAVDWVRRNKRLSEAVEKRARESPQAENAPAEDAADRRHDLGAALQQLGPEEKTLLRMFYLDRLRIEEIAAAVAMPAGTVKYRLFQLRKNLQTFLEGERHARQKH